MTVPKSGLYTRGGDGTDHLFRVVLVRELGRLSVPSWSASKTKRQRPNARKPLRDESAVNVSGNRNVKKEGRVSRELISARSRSIHFSLWIESRTQAPAVSDAFLALLLRA